MEYVSGLVMCKWYVIWWPIKENLKSAVTMRYLLYFSQRLEQYLLVRKEFAFCMHKEIIDFVCHNFTWI